MKIPELIKDYFRYFKIIFKYNRNPYYIIDIFRNKSGIRVLDSLKIYSKTIVDIGANKGDWIDNADVHISKAKCAKN